MFGLRTGLIIFLSLALSGAGAASCNSGQRNTASSNNQGPSRNTNAPRVPAPGEEKNVESAGLKVLAEGSHVKVADAFVAIARDKETYAELRKMVGQLPELSAESFKTNVVVAAFLGQRRTGGFSIVMTSAEGGAVSVDEKRPAAGTMSAQVITTPFKVVSVPVNEYQPLNLTLGAAWQRMMRPYRVKSGDFKMTGGFAGRSESFQIEGDIRVLRQDNLATFIFDLKGTGGTQPREIKDAATGTVQKDGRISLPYLAAGTFVNLPPSALSVTGEFTNHEDKLSLAFGSLPNNVSDGYEGQGELDAAASAPAPQRNPAGDDGII